MTGQALQSMPDRPAESRNTYLWIICQSYKCDPVFIGTCRRKPCNYWVYQPSDFCAEGQTSRCCMRRTLVLPLPMALITVFKSVEPFLHTDISIGQASI